MTNSMEKDIREIYQKLASLEEQVKGIKSAAQERARHLIASITVSTGLALLVLRIISQLKGG